MVNIKQYEMFKDNEKYKKHKIFFKEVFKKCLI